VVELGSFSEAGRQLRLSRSAVSKYVGDLEQNSRFNCSTGPRAIQSQ